MWYGYSCITACHLFNFSMKSSNSLLHQYEHTLKEELESRKASYNHDMWVQLVVVNCF